MCIIFFNNKIKLDNVNDIMSTKVNKNVKLDTKIFIPENFVGVFYYKDKYLFTLPCGEYKLSKKDCASVIDKNLRRNKNRKKPTYNFNLHFISTNSFNVKLQFKAVTSFKEKQVYTISANYKICDSEVFAKELLTTWYKTTNKRTLSYINNWFKEFCEVIVRKYNKHKLSDNSNLLIYANKYFKKYGININSINLCNNKSSFFNTDNAVQSAEKTAEKKDTTINSTKIIDNENFCPKCQAKIIKGSAYCVRCGNTITKNLSFKD